MYRCTVLLLIFCLVLPTFTYAKPKMNRQHSAGQVVEVQDTDRFNAAERHRIRAFLANRERREQSQVTRDLPFGLQKKLARGKQLPPGWQKKVAPGHSLDYQVYRSGIPLPADLLRHLPPGPAGSEILQVNDTILRIDMATRAVLDMFDLLQGR